MKLLKWEELPSFMRTEDVKPYYEVLKKHRLGLVVKRFFDFWASSVLLVLSSPVLLLLAVWIKLDSQGPVFYRQERVTQYGRIFRIYKFRSMVRDADKVGSLVTVSGDSRITNVGAKLRGCRLDEFPQLINIWKGEMTFVGTRPEVKKYVKAYTNEMYATLLLPAGVTSEASIRFKDEDKTLMGVDAKEINKRYVQKVLPEKMKLNLLQIMKYSIFKEINIILHTVCVCFIKKQV